VQGEGDKGKHEINWAGERGESIQGVKKCKVRGRDVQIE